VRTEEEPSDAQKKAFRKRELVRLVYALAAPHESDRAGKFILYLLDDASSPDDAILAMRLGREIGRIDFSVRAAKKALGSDIVSLASGWPIIRFTSHEAEVETPLLLALCRQESEFFADAISPSDAIGLMQLLPSTAKEIARKNGLGYSYDRLFNPDYNAAIGAIYLGKMLEKFDGSYVFAIASYNAGPGRVHQWLDNYGRPEKDVHAMVDWIERIPTAETRNYVEHVLENVEVYRYVLAGHSTVPLKIAADLTR
jgi:soluble lytic murein transglycosylase